MSTDNKKSSKSIVQETQIPFMAQEFDKKKNLISDKDIEKLLKEKDFSLEVKKIQRIKACCTHRMPDGVHDSLYEDIDGTVTCSICGYNFKPLSANTSIESIQASAKDILNVIQTTKLLLNNPEIAGKMYDCIPIIEKLPELFELASKEYKNKSNNYLNNLSFNNPLDCNKSYNTNFPSEYEYNGMAAMQLFNALNGMMPYINDHNLKNK